MKILYFGSLCDKQLFNKKLQQKQPFFIAQYSYEQALCCELEKDKDICIEYVTIYQTSYFPKDNFCINNFGRQNKKYKLLAFLNLPFLRELSYFFSTIFRIVCWAVKYRKDKKKCIYSSMHFTPVSLGIVLVANLFHLKKIVTFTDLPLFTYKKSRVAEMPFYKRVVMGPYIRLTKWLQGAYDGYVLFTENMNKVVNKSSKPNCIVEGIFNSSNINLKEPLCKKNAIAHAGTLSHLVGIKNILEVHHRLKTPVELWLMGDGDMVEEISQWRKNDKSLIYYGFLPREQVFEKLKTARLLLVLRDPADEYTQYSFPSKFFEYMVSGTPVFTTCLSGIPKEYYNYLYCTKSTDLGVVATQVEAVLKKPDEELIRLGKKAQNFILKEKNAKVQAAKIRDFLFAQFI